MELRELFLPEALEILPGVSKRVLKPGEDGIERIEFFDGKVAFKVNGEVAAIVWIPVPGTVMYRDLTAKF